MIVLISPSKTFSNTTSKGKTKPVFIDKALRLKQQLKRLTIDEIKTTFKLSEKLASEVFGYYQNDQLEVAAINLYDGVLYKELRTCDLTFENNKLYIFSALYGILRPFDSISKYRLDFNTKELGNLYNYWQEGIINYFKKTYQNEIIINLASKEFSPLIKGLNNVITIDFRDENNQRLSSVRLKKLRGTLANNIINGKINNINELKKAKVEELKYNKELSNESNIIFSI